MRDRKMSTEVTQEERKTRKQPRVVGAIVLLAVIIGGLISSRLLEFLVRPALFWTVGRRAGRRLVERAARDVLAD